MLRSCSYCGGIHSRADTCPSKPAKVEKVTYIDRFRWSKAWQRKRKQINDRDKYLCQVCLQEGEYNYTDLSVHHITPIRSSWDKRLDDDNLITLCSEHHDLADKNKIKRKELRMLVDGFESGQ